MIRITRIRSFEDSVSGRMSSATGRYRAADKYPHHPMLRSAALHAVALVLRCIAALGPTGTKIATTLSYSALPRYLASGASVRVRRMNVGFALNLDDNVQRTLFYTGWYERPFLDLLRLELRLHDVYIDVGAHVGIDAVMAANQLARLGGGQVIAFEPAPDTAGALRQTAARESLNIDVVEAALGNQAGVVELRQDPHFPSGDASVRSKFNHGPVVCRAPVVVFDEWASARGLEHADIVKLDIEGAEHEALQGMERMLSVARPRVLVVEIRKERLHQGGHTGEDFDLLLESVGYRRAKEIQENVVYRPI